MHCIRVFLRIAIPGQCCWENWGWQRECEGILGPASHTNNDFHYDDDEGQILYTIHSHSFGDNDEVSDGEMRTGMENLKQ